MFLRMRTMAAPIKSRILTCSAFFDAGHGAHDQLFAVYFDEENYDSGVIQLAQKRINAKWKKILQRREKPFGQAQTTD